MRKRAMPEGQRGLAPLVIGLGPNFTAQDNCDLAVETGWGDDLGRVVEAGPCRTLAGEPKPIGGWRRERYVYAPAAGMYMGSASARAVMTRYGFVLPGETAGK